VHSQAHVQRLLAAKRDLQLENLLHKLDHFHVIVCDDLGYVKQDREEMEVFFTFLAERYERRSVMLSSNLVFSKWDQIFKDPTPSCNHGNRSQQRVTLCDR
jgi:DNA replication protein DnaC